MLRTEENELLCRVGPGTPMGELFRRYWLPALTTSEIPEPNCPPVRVRLLGEDLIALRATQQHDQTPREAAVLPVPRGERAHLRVHGAERQDAPLPKAPMDDHA